MNIASTLTRPYIQVPINSPEKYKSESKRRGVLLACDTTGTCVVEMIEFCVFCFWNAPPIHTVYQLYYAISEEHLYSYMYVNVQSAALISGQVSQL